MRLERTAIALARMDDVRGSRGLHFKSKRWRLRRVCSNAQWQHPISALDGRGIGVAETLWASLTRLIRAIIDACTNASPAGQSPLDDGHALTSLMRRAPAIIDPCRECVPAVKAPLDGRHHLKSLSDSPSPSSIRVEMVSPGMKRRSAGWRGYARRCSPGACGTSRLPTAGITLGRDTKQCYAEHTRTKARLTLRTGRTSRHRAAASAAARCCFKSRNELWRGLYWQPTGELS
jgi:hypothetical protein